MAKTAKSTAKPAAPPADDNPSIDSEAAQPTNEQIALRAYHIYLERGGADGDPLDDWLQAERELTEARS